MNNKITLQTVWNSPFLRLFNITMLYILFVPSSAFAASAKFEPVPGLLWSPWSISALIIFIVCYALVPLENTLHIKKSKPVLLAAGLIWILAAMAYTARGHVDAIHAAVEHNILEYSELLLFLLAAMTFINSLEDRNVFQVLRAYLVSRGFTLRQIFWATGAVAFLLSPVADNLTTAMLMGAVVMAVGGRHKGFIAISCTNIVVAANAGGAFSPFGDITTLMVWQSGKVGFFDFFHIFLPALVSWLVPAFAMMWAIPTLKPRRVSGKVELRFGAEMMCFLFLAAIVFAVCFHNFLHLPPAMGMMFGLALHGFYSYRVQLHEGRPGRYEGILGAVSDGPHSFIREVSDSDEALEQIVDRGCVPAFAIDKNHTVTHWNTALKDLTGISPEDLIGSSKHWTPFYKEERAILADMVVDQVPIEEAAKHYHGQLRENAGIEQAYDAVSYFPNIGDGKWLTFTALPVRNDEGDVVGAVELIREVSEFERERARFDLMRTISRAEWDTLLFFYGVILSVGGLALFGFLEAASHALYSGFGATMANSFVGLISSVLDNIPVMFAVLTMDPSMSVGQWLLVTLTAGVGGSMLAVGSAAGVALLGTAHGQYTFMSHLKWTPVILLGYAASILCHLLINSVMM